MSVIATFDSMKQINAAVGMLELISKLGLESVHASVEGDLSSGLPTPIAEVLHPLSAAVPSRQFSSSRVSVAEVPLLKAWALHRFDYGRLHRELLGLCAGLRSINPTSPMVDLRLHNEKTARSMDFSVLAPPSEADAAERWMLDQFAWLPGTTCVSRCDDGSSWVRISDAVQRHAQVAQDDPRYLAAATLDLLRQAVYGPLIWVDGRVYSTGDYIPYTNRALEDLSRAGAKLFSTDGLKDIYAESVEDAKKFLGGAGSRSTRVGYLQPELPLTLRILQENAPDLVVLRDRTFYCKVAGPDGETCAVVSGQIHPDCNPY